MQDNLADAAPPGRARRGARGGPAGRRRRRRRPPGRARGDRGRASSASLGPPDLAGRARARHRRRHPRADRPVRVIANRSSGKQGYAVADEAAPRGAPGHPRHHRRPRRSPPGGRGRAGRDAPPRWSRRGRAAAPTGRRRRHGRGRRRLPARGPAAGGRSRRTTAPPEVVLEPTTDILADLGARQAGRARCSSASRPRPTTSWPTRAGKLAAQGPRPHRRQRRLGARRRLRARHQRGRDPRRPTARDHDVPLADKRAVAAAVLDASSSGAIRNPIPPPTRSTREQALDLHLGVGHRGPSRQDGRPDLRRRPRRHPGRGPDGAGRLRDARHHRPVRRRRRDHHDRPTSTSPGSSARRSRASATTASRSASTATPAA